MSESAVYREQRGNENVPRNDAILVSGIPTTCGDVGEKKVCNLLIW